MPVDRDWLFQARRELYRRFPVAAVAFSADGQDVEWAGPLDIGIESGEIAVAEREDETLIVVQIHEARIAQYNGPELSLTLDREEFGDFAGTARVTPTLRAVSGSGLVLGYLRGGAFSSVDRTNAAASPPFGELPLRGATDVELMEVATGLDKGQPTIQVGAHRQADRVPGRLRSKGFGRHTFMCGSPDPVRPTRPACCSNGCWPIPDCRWL